MLNLTDIESGREKALDRLLTAYAGAVPDRYDEMLGADGQVRPQYRVLLDWLSEIGPGGYRDASSDLQRLRTDDASR